MKDAYYFPHDSNSTNDPKIMLMIAQWGLEAYGIFWTIIEHLREQPNYKSHISILKALASRYNSTEEKYRSVVMSFNLFKIENEEFFYSESLIKRLQPMLEKRENMRRLALKRWSKNNDNQQDNASGMRTHSKRNASKVKESKVKESKNNMQGSDPAPPSKYNLFVDLFNKTAREASGIERKFRGDAKSKRQFNARIKEGYTGKDFQKAIFALYKSKHHEEDGFIYATPELITRSEKLEIYLNTYESEHAARS